MESAAAQMALLLFRAAAPSGGGGSQGPNSPAAGDSDGFFGAQWADPGNVTAADGNYATLMLADTQATDHLIATRFGFAIPGGATITGVLVEWLVFGQDAVGDYHIELVVGGAVAGGNLGAAGFWPSTPAYRSYGGPAELWGLSLTPVDVNATDFGASLAGINLSGGDAFAGVDHVRITVYYTT